MADFGLARSLRDQTLESEADTVLTDYVATRWCECVGCVCARLQSALKFGAQVELQSARQPVLSARVCSAALLALSLNLLHGVKKSQLLLALGARVERHEPPVPPCLPHCVMDRKGEAHTSARHAGTARRKSCWVQLGIALRSTCGPWGASWPRCCRASLFSLALPRSIRSAVHWGSV